METKKFADVWLENQRETALEILQEWSSINSWSENHDGLLIIKKVLTSYFSKLGDITTSLPLDSLKKWDKQGQLEVIPLPDALSVIKRKDAKRKILFGGHMDTVFPPTSPFQNTIIKDDRMIGPGVADMKGGLLVLYLALSLFEMSPESKEIGWEVLITPDEEIGSPGSRRIWEEKAKQYQLGLVFEPAFADGSIVSERKGSENYTVIVKGTAAHAGREFHTGKSAIKGLALWIAEVYKFKDPKTTFNIGSIHGGGPLNIVPDFAMCRINIRSPKSETLNALALEMRNLAKEISEREEISIEIHLDKASPPKELNEKNHILLKKIFEVGKEMGLDLKQTASGGASDGNFLSAQGLPVIDSMGVIGGELHTSNEYMVIDSLFERAKLCYNFLVRYATEDIQFL